MSQQQGLPWRYTTSTVLGNNFEMTVVTPLESMAELDKPSGLGGMDVNLDSSLDISNSTILSRRRFVVAVRPDMSMESLPESGTNAVYRFQVKSGQSYRFTMFWTERVIPALIRSGIQGTQVYQTIAGGKEGEFISITPIENFAYLDGGGPFRGLAPLDAITINTELGLLLDEMDISFTRIDQELSYGLAGL